MPPNQPVNSNQPEDPLFGAPFPQSPQPAGVISPQPEPAQQPPASGGKKGLVIGLIVGGLLLVLVLAVVIAVVAGSNKKTASPAKSGTSDSQSQGPTPATSSSTQLTDDSISQDISSLNDDKDLPADKLSDRSLGL